MKNESDRLYRLEREHFPRLLEALRQSGYRVVGPTVREGAIVYDDLHTVADLPIGLRDEQDGGVYRLRRRKDQALFGYVVGPHSWKKFLFPPRLRLWRASRNNGLLQIEEPRDETERLAFLGVRACELSALAIQDKIFAGGPYVDPHYQTQREKLFIVAVNCTEPGGTCFCASMNTGPKATFGYDLALTEVLEQGRHYFLVEVGTPQGRDFLQQLPHQEAGAETVAHVDRLLKKATRKMGRTLQTDDLKQVLYDHYESAHWEEVAQRCLTCANCTLVCPTCFCSTVEDVTDLDGEHAERWRLWDSCFTQDFSYIHGGSIRTSAAARYRQWLTHKLATWQEQFGMIGCVGCGRCITWCPVGIDLTAEVHAIRQTAQPSTQENP